jgi:hypothetical protein
MIKSIITTLLLTTAIVFAEQQSQAIEKSHSISGSVLVNDEHYGIPGKPCNFFRRSFNDIKGGFSIVVKNGKGDILATATSPAGSLVEMTKPAIGTSESTVNCEVPIPAFQVPDSDFYAFELAGRKAIVRSKSEMEANKWRLDLSIGGRE